MNILIDGLDEETRTMLTMSHVDVADLISSKQWYLGVNFEETSLDEVLLFKARDNSTNRFAPSNGEVCYLAKDVVRIEDEIQYVGTFKSVKVSTKPTLLNLDLDGPIRGLDRVNPALFQSIRGLMVGKRTKENYEASCEFAEFIFSKGFDGIYYSPHPDAKIKVEGEIARLSNEEIARVSPHFGKMQVAWGSYTFPLLVIFQRDSDVIDFVD